MTIIDSAEDFDSYMITEEDVTNTNEFAKSAFDGSKNSFG